MPAKILPRVSRALPAAVTFVATVSTTILLAQAMKTLPLTAAYAIWTGIGAVGTAGMGMALFSRSTKIVQRPSGA